MHPQNVSMSTTAGAVSVTFAFPSVTTTKERPVSPLDGVLPPPGVKSLPFYKKLASILWTMNTVKTHAILTQPSWVALTNLPKSAPVPPTLTMATDCQVRTLAKVTPVDL